MTTCITCQHWQPKKTDRGLARMGFAQCEKKHTGHTTSAEAAACDRHSQVDDKTAQARAKFIRAQEKA